jgi:dephospho-CoA kinase
MQRKKAKAPTLKHPDVSARVIGLSGGIGSGKSAVARMLQALGATVIDAYKIAHEVLDRSAIIAVIRKNWGAAVIARDGKVNRAALARLVFGKNEELEKLNALAHPPIRAEMKRQMQLARRRKNRLIVIDAPLLFEAGLESNCDALVFVAAPRKIRVQRARARHGWNATELDRREKWQMSPLTKRRRSQYVIDNGGNLARTEAQARELYEQLSFNGGVAPH